MVRVHIGRSLGRKNRLHFPLYKLWECQCDSERTHSTSSYCQGVQLLLEFTLSGPNYSY
ncbi:hypothetical protein L218DRAFT_967677 [Marasmius fiardii PR-910]|nr:hypothetical protein L218DRAFT_967677 [Marasmius fiardii PR-910]